MGTTDEDEPTRSRQQRKREQEHVANAAAGLSGRSPVDGRTNDVLGRVHVKCRESVPWLLL